MKIGFVSDTNPFTDRTSWSGTVYKLRESIERAGYEVVWIQFDKRLDDFSSRWRRKLLEWYMKHSRKLVVGTCYLDFFCRYYARAIERQGLYAQCDCLFFAGPSGAQIARHLRHQRPYIYLADACYHLMENYYWFNLSPYFARRARRDEEWATQQAWINIRSSQWAAEGTIRYCHAPRQRMYVLEFGANIDDALIRPARPYPSSGQLHILFSGTDWERKGGDVAVETVACLRRMGHDAVLSIVGISQLPASCRDLPYVRNVGFFNKNDANDYASYLRLWETTHLFLLPTRAECSAIVFSEAAAYSVPVFTYDTGGTSNYVHNGKNGYMLRPGDGPQQFAHRIDACIRSGELPQLAAGARRLYDEVLSWSNWSRRFREIIENSLHALHHL